MKWCLPTLALLSGLILSAPALAASCTVSTVGVAFGSYDVFSSVDTDSTGTVIVSCHSIASYKISLSAGAGTFTSRLMAGEAAQLHYNLFIDPQRLTVWGDGTSGTATVSARGTGGSYPVYGRIPALQNVPAGSYSDTLTVTVTY
jgi:spore coat protein U-like protein